MALDLSRDYLLFDDPLTVRYAVKTAEGEWAEGVDVEYAQRNAITKDDAEDNPALLQELSTVFHLWQEPLGAMTPKIGDKVGHPIDNETDGTSSTVWLVRSVGELDRDAQGVQRYRLVCTRSNGTGAI